MSDTARDERIRIRADEIWERNGRREGRPEDDWDEARREIEMEDTDAAGLNETITAAIGLAVGAEPEGSLKTESPRPSEPAEGGREVVERQLSRKKKKS